MQASFRVDIDRIRTRVGQTVSKKVDSITQRLVDGFVSRSPVYTGNFRASWNVSEGRAVYVKVDSGSPAAALPPPVIKVKSLSRFPVMYITNGQPYAQKLEYGWSNQAPMGFVRVTIASLR